KWEVEVWTPKINELFGDEPTVFLVDLRNYSMHYAIPVMSMSTNFHSAGGPGGPTAMSNTVAVNRIELLKWDGWRSKGKSHITSTPGDSIDIITPIATYSMRVREFYGWFWEQITNSARPEITEYDSKSMEFGHYLEVEGTVSQFGPDWHKVLRARLAEARLRRVAFGTSCSKTPMRHNGIAQRPSTIPTWPWAVWPWTCRRRTSARRGRPVSSTAGPK